MYFYIHSETAVLSVTVLSLSWQAGEGLGSGCTTRQQTARPGTASEEAAKGAKLRLFPAQDAGTQVWSVLSDWNPVHHLSRRLHVRHSAGAKVRHKRQLHPHIPSDCLRWV